MRSRRSLFLAGAVLAVAAAAALSGCSKSKATSPTGGGGGTLNVPLAANGGTGSFTFNAAGVFPYKCGLHPVMTGDTVMVSMGSTADQVPVSVVGTSAPGFNPRTVTVKVGGTVRWSNPDGNDHVVVPQ